MVKNIFITGVSGFIGQHLLEELRDDYSFVYALSRNYENNEVNNVRFIKGDLLKINELSDILSSIDYFINIAGEKSDENLMFDVNVKGVSAILAELVKYHNIKFLQVSSAGVYGIESHPEVELTENMPVYPTNIYEKTKYEAERVIINFGIKTGLKYSIIRPSNVFGENDKGLKLLNLLKALNNNQFFYINPNAVVNYVYVKQVTSVIKQLIEKDIFYNKIYNVNAACTISEFIAILKSALHLQNKIKQIPKHMSFIIKIIAKIADLLPKRYQFINSCKYRELTSLKYYATKELKKDIIFEENKLLEKGVYNLVAHYKKKGLL